MEHSNPISQELLETIERYLKNTMSVEERNTFEEKIKDNSTLQQQVKNVESILYGVRRGVFKNKVEAFHEEVISEELKTKKDKKVFNLNYKYTSVAASIVVLVGSFWYFNREPKHEQLYSKYFKPDYGLATNMSENKSYELFDAMVDYREGNYNTAIKKWENLLISKPKNDTLYYFLGVSYLAKNINEEAILKLQNVITDTESIFNKEAYLYLGLAYLKSGNITKAKENFVLSNTEKGRIILSELKD